MNRLLILSVLAALCLWTGCTKEPDYGDFVPREGDRTPVRLTAEAENGYESGTEFVPMTRAEGYRTCVKNAYCWLLLKESGRRWVVDTMLHCIFDPEIEKDRRTDELRCGTALPANGIDVELRPGNYRAVCLLNGKVGEMNPSLVPGTVVYDADEPNFQVPYLVRYAVSKHPDNAGYWSLSREVFAGTADFTVARREDLHQGGPQPIRVTVTRRVAMFELAYRQYSDSETAPLPMTQLRGILNIRSLSDQPLCTGVDALGGAYYDRSAPTMQFDWVMQGGSFRWYELDGEEYMISQPNNTVFSPFLFADPALKEGMPVRITIKDITAQSDEPGYTCTEKFERTLKANRADGVVLRPDGGELAGYPRRIMMKVVKDGQGVPLKATELFPPYFRWNL